MLCHCAVYGQLTFSSVSNLSFQCTNGGFEAFVNKSGELNIAVLNVSEARFYAYEIPHAQITDGQWVCISVQIYVYICVYIRMRVCVHACIVHDCGW